MVSTPRLGRLRVLLARPLLLALPALLVAAACGGDDGGTAADNGTGPNRGEEFVLNYTTLYAPGSAVEDSMGWWMDEVERRTDGRVRFERFYGASLLAGADTLAGLNEGRADAGLLVPAYTPAQLPLWNIGMVPGAGMPSGLPANNEAHARAIGWLGQNNEAFIGEQEREGVKSIFYLISGTLAQAAVRDPITSVSDLEGLQVRSLGPVAKALSAVGTNPVAIEAQESYEAVQRGVIAGIQGLPFDLMPQQGIHEVAPWIARLGLGHFGTASMAISLRQWNQLPEDIQQVMLDVADDFYAEMGRRLAEVEESSCDTFLEAGGGVTLLPDDEVDAWLARVGDELVTDWRNDATAAGASEQDVASVEQDFTEAIESEGEEATYVDGLLRCAERTAELNRP